MAEKNILTTSRFDHPINVVFIQQFLAYAMPYMPHAQFGKKVKMPAHSGDTVKWRRLTAPTAQKTPLDETQDPTPILPAKTDISASVSEYGAQVRKSGWSDLTGLSQENAELTQWLSDQFKLTLDELCRDVIAGTASTTTCSNGSPTVTMINITDIRTVVRTLLANNTKPITTLMGAATGQGTSPLPPSFIGIADVDLMHQIQALAGFKEVKNYAAPGQAYDNEFGSTDWVRWILTSNGYTSGSNYYLPIIGQDAYGNVSIPEGKEILGYTPPEQAGSDMNRYSVYYWLMNYVAKILDDIKIHTMICTAS